MTKPGETGIKRIISATRYSIKGLSSCWRSEAAFRQEVMGSVVLVPLAFYLGDNGMEVALMILTCMLVLIVELLNSGIEAVVDRVSFELHELSKRAKDIASAAVMLTLLLCAGVWSAALYHRFF